MLVDTRPRVAEYTRDGEGVWVSAEIGGTVTIFDAKTFEITEKLTFDIPGIRPELIQPIGVRFTLDGKQAFVALGPSNRVAVVDVATLRHHQLHRSSASGHGTASAQALTAPSSSSPTA